MAMLNRTMLSEMSGIRHGLLKRKVKSLFFLVVETLRGDKVMSWGC